MQTQQLTNQKHRRNLITVTKNQKALEDQLEALHREENYLRHQITIRESCIDLLKRLLTEEPNDKPNPMHQEAT